ncbi:MAG: trigger factor [Dehalococcoidia bacterium]|jgi:trigger factor|nr:trigger factor [Chloroflexota bacterium]MDP7613337.1 trigger factor [Dehalococcoidia bacterium]
MKITVEDSTNREKILHMEVDDDRLEKHVKQAIKHHGKNVNIPGFRKGKAPSSIVENFLGRNWLVNKALESLIPDVIQYAIDEHKITAVATPKVTKLDVDPVRLEARVALEPEVVIDDYSDLVFDDSTETIDEKKVQLSIDQLLEAQAIWQPVEKPVGDGYMAIIDCAGAVGDDELMSVKSTEFIISPGNPIPVPGFTEELLDLKIGEKKQFNVLIPDDFTREEFRNKQANFNVNIIGIKEKILPELNNEFVVSLGEEDIHTVDSLRNRIESNLKIQSEDQLRRTLEEKIIETLIDRSTFDISPLIVEREVDQMVENQKQSLERYKLDFDSYLERIGQTQDDFMNQTKESAENRVKRSIIMDKLVEIENIKPEPEDIDNEMNLITKGDTGLSKKDNIIQRENLKIMLSRKGALDAIISRTHKPNTEDKKKTSNSKKDNKKSE